MIHWFEMHTRIGLFSPVILYWLYRIESLIRRFSNVAKLLELFAEENIKPQIKEEKT